MPFAAALSEHPVPASAAGEVIGEVLERGGAASDLAVVFVTGAHAGAIEDIAAAVRATMAPRTLLGCAAASVVGNAREVEEQPAVVLWAGHLGGAVQPLLLDAHASPDGTDEVAGWPDPVLDGAQAVLLLADPYSFAPASLFAHLATVAPGLPVVGGMTAASGPGRSRLVVDDRVVTAGAVGAVIGRGCRVETVVSQGCRPIGEPYVVTRSERNVIYELASRPALERLSELAGRLPEEDMALLNRGLHLGRAIDEAKLAHGRGDFLVRNVLGGDRDTGAIAVGDEVEIGTTVQFHVRDAASADEDLRDLLVGRHADGALLFTCNGRGTNLFGSADHDAGVVSGALGGAPIAGMFCGGELGPVGGRNHLHGFTASIALFSEGS